MSRPIPLTGNMHRGSQRLKHVLIGLVAGGTPDTNNDEYWADGDDGVAWVAIGDMSTKAMVVATEKRITESGIASKRLRVMPPGTLVYSMYASMGLVAELAIPATINQALLGFEFIDRVAPSFVKWWLRHLQPLLIAEASSNTQDNLNADKVKNLPFPSVDIHFQTSIANYLDRETARIDGLIAQKERMLALLEEKRAALISRVVTRGLDPNAPLKPSGQEWLGEIPAHWELPPVYARFEVQLGKMLDEKKIKGTHLASYLRNVDVQWGAINTIDLPEMDFDDEGRMRYALRAGDILVCEGGEIGRAAIWAGDIEECYYQKALHRLRSIRGEDNPQFFVMVMFTLVNIGVFYAQSIAATIQHLPAEKIRNVRFPAPPLSEQEQIVAFLNQEGERIQTISRDIARSVSLLKERRAALISAAVTGQLSFPEVNLNVSGHHGAR